MRPDPPPLLASSPHDARESLCPEAPATGPAVHRAMPKAATERTTPASGGVRGDSPACIAATWRRAAEAAEPAQNSCQSSWCGCRKPVRSAHNSGGRGQRGSFLFGQMETLRLQIEHGAIAATEGDQFFMRAQLDDVTLLQHADPIRMA